MQSVEIRKKRVNDTAIIVISGKIYTRTGVDDAVWLQILEACEELESSSDFKTYTDNHEKLMNLVDQVAVAKKIEEELAKEKAIKDLNLESNTELRMSNAKRIADISGLFEYDENGITYLKGFKHPMPKILVEAVLDAHYNPASEYTVASLINFWKYLLLNPDKEVRSGLFKWINSGKFAITEGGCIIGYRNVDIKSKSDNDDLYDFITESYAKIRRWKKSPKKYWVYGNDDGDYTLLDNEPMPDGIGTNEGNLNDLYNDRLLSEENIVYTDDRTHTFKIKIGEPVSMPRKDCNNNPNDLCSSGLHIKSVSYGLNLGSTTLTCLINPYNVVVIPMEGNFSKFRCCEYLPIGKTEIVDGKIVEFQPGTYDIPYDALGELTELLKTNSLEELQSSGVVSAEVSLDDFNFVMKEAMKAISNRVVKLN